jgi:hypothetical protein
VQVGREEEIDWRSKLVLSRDSRAVSPFSSRRKDAQGSLTYRREDSRDNNAPERAAGLPFALKT